MSVHTVDVPNCLASINSILTGASAATVLFSDANTLIIQPSAERFDKPIKLTAPSGFLVVQTGDSWSSGANLSGTTKALVKASGRSAAMQQVQVIINPSAIVFVCSTLYSSYWYYYTVILTKNASEGLAWAIAYTTESTPTSNNCVGLTGLPILRTSDWSQGDLVQFSTGYGSALASEDGFYVIHDLVIRSATGVLLPSPSGVKTILQPPTANTVQLNQVGNDVILQTGCISPNTAYFIWNTVIVGGGV